MKISAVRVRQTKIPLKEPYPLSFTTVTAFQSSMISIETDSRSIGLGEVTALTGYSEETPEEIVSIINRAAESLPGMGLSQARRFLDSIFNDSPFAVSAIGTALDFAFDQVGIPESMSIPLIFPVSPYVSADVLKDRLKQAVQCGYKTVKVKIGRDIEQDLHGLSILCQASPEIVYRFDANQGYTLEEAVRFIKKVEEKRTLQIEALEQLLPPQNWTDMEKIRQMTAAPLMLDESIFNESDIIRAADIGMDFIKLKLCKTKGMSDLIAKAVLAHEKGLRVVLGNGVATDLTNLAEAIVFASYPAIFSGAFEGNGFVKMDKNILEDNPLRLQGGNLVWEKKQQHLWAPFWSENAYE